MAWDDPCGSSPFGLATRSPQTRSSLRSSAITAPSALLRTTPPLCHASVLSPYGGCPLGFSLAIGATGFHVPHQSPEHGHATSMPDAVWAVGRLPPHSSRGNETPPGSDVTYTLTTCPQRFAHARLRTPHLTRSSSCLFLNAHHSGSLPLQLEGVWRLLLQADAEGPSLISRAAASPTEDAFVAHSHPRTTTRLLAHGAWHASARRSTGQTEPPNRESPRG